MAANKLKSGKDSGKITKSGPELKQPDNNTDTGTETGTGTGTGTETGTGTGKRDVSKVPGMDVLEHGTPVLDLPEQIIPVPVTMKKKSHHKKAETKPAQNDTTADNLGLLLTTGFSIIALRAGSHWMLDETEVKAISEPLARIINRLLPAASTSKYTDYMLLGLGLTMTITPRVMLSIELSKGGKKGESEVKNISPKVNDNVNGGQQQTGIDDNTIKNHLSAFGQEG